MTPMLVRSNLQIVDEESTTANTVQSLLHSVLNPWRIQMLRLNFRTLCANFVLYTCYLLQTL